MDCLVLWGIKNTKTFLSLLEYSRFTVKKEKHHRHLWRTKESLYFFWIIFGYNWVWNCGFCLIGGEQTWKISKEKSLFPRLSCGESYEEILLVWHTSAVRYVVLFDKSAGLFCELQIKVVHSFLNLACLGNGWKGRCELESSSPSTLFTQSVLKFLSVHLCSLR